MMRFCSRLALAASIAVLAACVSAPKAEVPPAPPPPENAVAVGVTAGPAIAIQPSDAQRLYNAFIASCPAMLKRTDASGLTRPEDWQALCHPLDFESPEGAVEFFQSGFQLVQIGDGSAFATGYYEPRISGSRAKAAGFEVPVYAKPADLLAANPATGEKGRGRVDEEGNYVLYHDRAAIEDGALAGKGLEIAWAADPIDLFFLQIQGSGQLLLPDGGVMRIGYADQNGREYVAIGKLLKERGLINGTVSMQAITDWLRANPEQGRALMRENKSYVFFRELTGPGPLGAMGVAVTPKRSVAADPRFIPLGAPVLLDLDYDQADGFWVAQDTGGAIKGANRFDTFWGAGQGAAAISGGLQARGRAYVMLPKAAVARLLAGRDAAQTQR